MGNQGMVFTYQKSAFFNFLGEEQGKSEGFDKCYRPSNLKLYSNRQFFRLCDREIWWMTSKKQ